MAPILQFQYYQARRTGTSNALGELFDHGCDSVTTIFVVLGAAQGLQASVWWLRVSLLITFTAHDCRPAGLDRDRRNGWPLCDSLAHFCHGHSPLWNVSLLRGPACINFTKIRHRRGAVVHYRRATHFLLSWTRRLGHRSTPPVSLHTVPRAPKCCSIHDVRV